MSSIYYVHYTSKVKLSEWPLKFLGKILVYFPVFFNDFHRLKEKQVILLWCSPRVVSPAAISVGYFTPSMFSKGRSHTQIYQRAVFSCNNFRGPNTAVMFSEGNVFLPDCLSPRVVFTPVTISVGGFLWW